MGRQARIYGPGFAGRVVTWSREVWVVQVLKIVGIILALVVLITLWLYCVP
ncbi:MAG: hypothetical protein AB1776_03565 [Bacillota bacterium]